MPIKFECPSCKKKLSVNDQMAGRKAACPNCKKPLVIPKADSSAAPPSPPAPAVPAPSAPAPAPAASKPARPRAPAAAKPSNGSAEVKTAPEARKPAPPPLPRKDPPKPVEPLPPAPADLEAEAASVWADAPKKEEQAPQFIEFTCPMCDAPLKLSADQAGKRSPCPDCGRIIKIPELAKNEPKDWRKLARNPVGTINTNAEPAPEGAWGSTTSTSTVSKDSLIEADAIPDVRDPLTLQQKIVRGVGALAVVGVLLWGGMQLLGWWALSKEQAQLKFAESYAAGAEAVKQLGPNSLAALQAGIGDYYRRGKKPGCAPLARQYYEKALNLLRPSAPADAGEGDAPAPRSWDHDLVLADLALAQADMGGTPDQVDEGLCISWDDAQRTMRGSLRAIYSSEARLYALRPLTRRLIARDQGQRAINLVKVIFDDPGDKIEGLAMVGLEMVVAKQNDLAQQAGQQVLEPYQGDGEKPLVRAAVVALAMALSKEPPKPVARGPKEESDELVGRAEGLTRVGKLAQARALLKDAPPNPEVRLRILLGILAAGLDTHTPEINQDAESAFLIAKDKLVASSTTSWLLLRLIELGAQAGLDEARLTELTGHISEMELRGRAQLLVLRDRLARTKGAVEESVLEGVKASNGAQYLARLALARHNIRYASGITATVQGWPEPQRAFGSVGLALGLQGGD